MHSSCVLQIYNMTVFGDWCIKTAWSILNICVIYTVADGVVYHLSLWAYILDPGLFSIAS